MAGTVVILKIISQNNVNESGFVVKLRKKERQAWW